MFRLTLFFALISAALFAQSTPNAAPPPYVRVQYFNNAGQPCASCALWTYAAGTTTLQVTYTDQTAMTANTDPIILDGSGRAAVYINTNAYKFTLENPIPIGFTHGTQIWTVDNITLTLPASSGGGVTTANVTYIAPFSGAVGINLGTYLLSYSIDVRSFGATGYTGTCHSLTQDDQPYIQAALNYAYANGPAEVYLPAGYCWPIGTHLWVPPTVHFHGYGRTTGYEVSSAGSLLIANTSWASNNTAFPYSQMVWSTGDNFTSGTYTAATVTFGTEIDHMEINCNDQVGCGNVLAIGRQEKSTLHDVLLTGGVAFSGGYSYGFYEEGVDCNGSTPPTWGCLLPGSGSGNPFSGQQGPDYHLEIFPSYNSPTANFIPFAEMGANNYKGLRDSTINGISAGAAYGEYFWGEETTLGPGIHSEGTSTGSLWIGNIPAGSGCNGGSQDLFTGFDTIVTIASCSAQQNLTFINDAGGVQNNSNSTTITTKNYFYSAGPPAIAGWPGIDGGGVTNSSIQLIDPAEYVHTGYNGLNFFNGTSHAGMNLAVLLDANAVYSRGYLGSSIWWNHGTGLWNWLNNGGTSYSSVQFINGGAGFCNSTTSTATFTMATLLGQCQGIFSNANHLLLGPNWISMTTGLTVNEGSDPLQVAGNINLSGHFTGSAQFASSSSTSCPTASGPGSTCTFTVTWPTAYGSTPKAVCSLNGTITGAPSIQAVAPTTTGATVTVQNGTASQAVASGATSAVCWATP